MGVSENSVPLNPMVLLIIIPMTNGYFIGNIPNIFRQTQIRPLTQKNDRWVTELCGLPIGIWGGKRGDDTTDPGSWEVSRGLEGWYSITYIYIYTT